MKVKTSNKTMMLWLHGKKIYTCFGIQNHLGSTLIAFWEDNPNNNMDKFRGKKMEIRINQLLTVINNLRTSDCSSLLFCSLTRRVSFSSFIRFISNSNACLSSGSFFNSMILSCSLSFSLWHWQQSTKITIL